MDGVRDGQECPNCGSTDVPRLIVRGSGAATDGVSLQCRRCHHEWSDDRTRSRQAS